MRRKEYSLLAVGKLDRDEDVVVIDSHRDDAVAAYIGKLGKLGLLYCAAPAHHHYILALFKFADRKNASEFLLLGHIQEVDNGFASARGGGVRDLVDLQLIDFAPVRE